MNNGLSQNPYKKAAVTSTTIIFLVRRPDIEVAALGIRLLAMGRPGVPENSVSRSLTSSKLSRHWACLGLRLFLRSFIGDHPLG